MKTKTTSHHGRGVKQFLQQHGADVTGVIAGYTDSTTQERRESTLPAEEFMRRYLQHVLPPGQHRVRYFGWMHPAAKARRAIIEAVLAVPIVVRPKVEAPEPWHLRCPHCGGFTLVCVGKIPRSPPACDR